MLPGAPPPAEEHADIDEVVAYWDDSAAMRLRLAAVAQASASVVLFLEYIPHTVRYWLDEQNAIGPDAMIAAVAMVERRMRTDVAFMNVNGLLHFDAHFQNILTDGHRLYFADLGLAVSPRFDLSADERDFVAANGDHDAGYVLRELVNWLVAQVVRIPFGDTGGPVARYDYIRRCAAGTPPIGIPEPVADLIRRYASAAAIMNDFYWDVYGESRTTPCPEQELNRALAAIPPRDPQS